MANVMRQRSCLKRSQELSELISPCQSWLHKQMSLHASEILKLPIVFFSGYVLMYTYIVQVFMALHCRRFSLPTHSPFSINATFCARTPERALGYFLACSNQIRRQLTLFPAIKPVLYATFFRFFNRFFFCPFDVCPTVPRRRTKDMKATDENQIKYILNHSRSNRM